MLPYLYFQIIFNYSNNKVISNNFILMSNDNYPRPPGHKTFLFQPITISSDFDSGNCFNAEKVGTNQFNIWIATDHPKNNYRTWFHFSIHGVSKGSTVTIRVKNMQNQSRLLNQGLVPVYRQEGVQQWKRVSQRVNTADIEYNDGWIQWTFKHNFKNNLKHYFAFFYPWSNQENSDFLTTVEQKAKQNPNIYCYRSSIMKSIQGRSIEFLVISSHKYRSNKQQQFNDDNLFKNLKKPSSFSSEKQGIVLSARVHPGEVPGSHVMTGIIQTLVEPYGPGQLLRDEFVFYIFPILNPDGVARGHYRVDTNGINLNRCYLNPTPKQQPSIYSIRKVIAQLHQQNRFFAYLDLHAHASRKGTFIYGNCSNELMKQLKACIFPKLLSMNSIDFQYQGSNFTQKNMYSKDRGDHISKQGSGRVAMYKLTKNAYCWTMECNYNISRINNILEGRKQEGTAKINVSENSLDHKIITQYKQQQQVQAKQFFTIKTYHKLGKQICETFLDLIEKNPCSRIDNPQNYFKSVANVKMNLALALLRMAPNRFEATFKKVYSGIANTENPEIIKNSIRALYYLVIKNGKISNINNYIRSGDETEVVLPEQKKETKKLNKSVNFRTRQTRYNSIKSHNQINNIFSMKQQYNSQSVKNINQINNFLKQTQDTQQFKNILNNNIISQSQTIQEVMQLSIPGNSTQKQTKGTENSDQTQNLYSGKVLHIQKPQQSKKAILKLENFRMIGVSSKRKSNIGPSLRDTTKSCNPYKSTAPLQEGGVFEIKIINQELTCNVQQVKQIRKMKGLRKGPSFIQ